MTRLSLTTSLKLCGGNFGGHQGAPSSGHTGHNGHMRNGHNGHNGHAMASMHDERDAEPRGPGMMTPYGEEMLKKEQHMMPALVSKRRRVGGTAGG